MSFHQNYEKWLAMTEPANCPVCQGQPMPAGMLNIVELTHLHVHLYPRYRNDPYPDKPIDYHQKKRLYSRDEFQEFVTKMREAIQQFAVESR